MNRLKALNIYATSLYKDEAVNNLLNFNLSGIVDLNIGFTSISEGNAIRVLSAINTSNLQNLNICITFGIISL